MDETDTATRISLADASERGVAALVGEAEKGYESIVLRGNMPVAVIIGFDRFQRLQRLQEDLTDLAIAASKAASGEPARHALEKVLERLGYAREARLGEPDSDRLDASSEPAIRPKAVFRRTDPAAHPLIGRWRIVAMEMWDRAFIDLVEPGYIAFNARGGGDFVFGAVTGSLNCGYSPRSIDFTWGGNDEMDEAFGDGWAELQDDGSVEGEIRFHEGDESGFTARRW